MMRKFTFTLLMVLVFGSLSFGQYTASLNSVTTASPNENVSFDLNVTGFASIGSFQFQIQFDPAVLTFINPTNFSQSGLLPGVTGGNVVTLSWTSTTPHDWTNGRLLTLNFKYNGLSSPLTFLALQCAVTKLTLNPIVITPLTGTFTDGSITPFLGNVAHADIEHVLSPLGTVVVPVHYTGFPSTIGSPMTGSITQTFSYDPGKLTFQSVTGTGEFATGLNSSVSAGVVTVTWVNQFGRNINASLMNLHFTYTNLAATDVKFGTGCVITTASASPVNIPVSYFNGSVAPSSGSITSFASLPTLNTAIQGQIIEVPLTFSGMPAGTNNFDVFLSYDYPRMELINVIDQMESVTITKTNGTIHLQYVNTAAPLINGVFLKFRFRYNGTGTANIVFSNGCQFSDGFAPVGVGYTNGSVSPAPVTSGVSAKIGSVSATSPSPVDVPVTLTGTPSSTSLGAVTMYIAYDASKLTYVNSVSSFGASVVPLGNILQIIWYKTSSAIVINDTPTTFITLKFNYAASGSGPTQVIFGDDCQLAESVAGILVPANWINGGVNLFRSISGHLSYNNAPDPNVVLSGVTIYVKDGPEPVAPATTPVPTIIATTTTDAAGFYSVSVPAGNYYIYAASASPWLGVNNSDVINLRRYVAGLSNTIDNSLRLRASDINQDGLVNSGDVIPLRREIAGLTPNPNYLAPRWLFTNIPVAVSTADMSNIDILGICSGDINGSYPN
ncbi:MAG: cohesin domain-containing protein [Bacteroidetes bacterium]|nr:cohesin domain-containing protein [Bacteroidota bacterium]